MQLTSVCTSFFKWYKKLIVMGISSNQIYLKSMSLFENIFIILESLMTIFLTESTKISVEIAGVWLMTFFSIFPKSVIVLSILEDGLFPKPGINISFEIKKFRGVYKCPYFCPPPREFLLSPFFFYFPFPFPL